MISSFQPRSIKGLNNNVLFFLWFLGKSPLALVQSAWPGTGSFRFPFNSFFVMCFPPKKQKKILNFSSSSLLHFRPFQNFDMFFLVMRHDPERESLLRLAKAKKG